MTADTRPPILTLLARRPVLAFLLFALNARLVRELFGIEYFHYRDSIEAANHVLKPMLLHPECEGPGELRMVRGRGAGMTVVRAVSRLSLPGLLARMAPAPLRRSAWGWL